MSADDPAGIEAPATLAIECDDGIRTVRRTNNHPVTRIKAHRPRKVALNV